MLSRAALPFLRPRSVQVATRLAFSTSRFHYVRTDRGRLGQTENYKKPSEVDTSSSSHREPLRKVRASEGENIDPQEPQPESEASFTTNAERTRQSSWQNQKSRKDEDINSLEQEPSQPLPDLRDGIPSDYNPEATDRTPLPDLRQGIPSTFGQEFQKGKTGAQASKDSLNITEDPAEESTAAGSGRGGDNSPRNAYVSSSDRRRSKLTKFFYLAVGLGGIGYMLYLGRDWDDDEEHRKHPDIVNGYTPGLMLARAQARMGMTMAYYSDPVSPKLLPDEDPNPNLRAPFTLVLSLEDLLVHSEWTRENGWRIAKRPGVDYFLKYLSLYYELVLFTSQPSFTVDLLLRKLDPYSMMQYRLAREATLYKDGGYIKDLSYLNRDLKKVIIVDTDPHHVKNQPENAILLPKWTGDPKDHALVDLIPFLEYLANMGFDDAREVLKSFEGKNIPHEFDRRQKLIREKFEAQQKEKRKPKRSIGGFGSLFGTKPQRTDGLETLDEAAAEGKMIWDQIRERGQKHYMELEKRIQDEGAKWLAEQEALDKKMQEEAMESMKTGMFGWFGGSQKKGDS